MKLKDCLAKHGKLFSKPEQEALIALAQDNERLGIENPEGEAVKETLNDAMADLKEVSDEIAKPDFRQQKIQSELKDTVVRQELQIMADEAGWAEEGGHMIRDGEGASDEEIRMGVAHLVGNVIGRTAWVPKAAWWPDRPVKLRSGQVRVAVRKALAGEPLNKAEITTIEFMIDESKRTIKYGEDEAQAGPVENFEPEDYAEVAGLPDDQQEDAIRLADEAQGEIQGDNWNELSNEEKEDELDRLFGSDTRKAPSGSQGGAQPAQAQAGSGSVKLSQTTKADFDKYLEGLRAAEQQKVAAIGEVGDYAILRNEAGTRWQAVLPDVQGGGKWRTQTFDKDGFSGHEVFPSKQEAIESAARDGYYQRDDQAMHELQSTPSFQRGNEIASVIAEMNSKQIPWEEGNAKIDQIAARYKPLLETYTKADLAKRAEKLRIAQEKQEQEEAHAAALEKARAEKNTKVDQLDLFNTQGTLFSRENEAASVPAGFQIDEANREKTNRLEREVPGMQIIPVSPGALRGDTDNAARTGEAQGVERASRDLAERISGLFGKQVVWMTAKGPFHLNGAVIQGLPYVFLNVVSDKPAHVVLGHELTHHMEVDNPVVYERMQRAIGALMRNHEEYRVATGRPETISDVDLTKEMIGDVMGDNFNDRIFWKRVAEQAGGTFKQIATTVKRWLDRISGLITGKLGFGSDRFTADVNKARIILAQALADYANGIKNKTEGVPNGIGKLSYVGPNAAANSKSLARTFGIAREMDSSGNYHPDTVRMATGWFRNPFDKKWRREISDRSVKLLQAIPSDKPGADNSKALKESVLFGEEHTYPLSDVLDHPLLYKLYPAARDIQFVVRKGFMDSGGLQGWFDGDNKIGVTPYAQDPTSTILHELQHWIQHKEGFATGGNANTVLALLTKEQRDRVAEKVVTAISTEIQAAAKGIQATKVLEATGSAVAFKTATAMEKPLWAKVVPGNPVGTPETVAWWKMRKLSDAAWHQMIKDVSGQDSFLKLSKEDTNTLIQIKIGLEKGKDIEEIRALFGVQMMAAQKELTAIQSGDLKAVKDALEKTGEAHNLYLAIAGEIEARDVQARKDMGFGEREAYKPTAFGLGNIDPNDVIVSYAKPGASKVMLSQQPNVANVLQSNPVSNFISAQVNSPTSLGIFKAFNTQYHKAVMLARKGLPQFKRVFDKMQQYLTDTNAMAIHAEQQGQAIFREAKNIGDFFKGAASDKDVQTLQPWLNGGTLYGGASPMEGIVWTDAELKGQQGTRLLPRGVAPLTDKQVEMYHQARAVIDTSLETGAKSVIFRHTKKYDVTFDKFDPLDNVVDSVKTQLTDKMAEAQIQGTLAQDLADTAFAEFQAAEADALADPTDRQKRVTLENSKDAWQRAQKESQIADARVATFKTLIGEPGKPGTIDKIREQADKLAEHGYMPLKRFGSRTVTAVDPQGKKRFFGAFDGTPLVPGSANYEMQNVAKEIQALHPDWTVTTGVRDEDSWKMFQGLSLDALENFLDFLDEDTKAELERDPIIQEYLANSVNNRSVMKELIHRKGTPGFSKDVSRVLAMFVTSHARNASGMYHIADAKALVNDIPTEQGDVIKEAVNLVNYVTQPGEEATKLRGFLFFHFLGASVAAGFVNLMQTPMMTFPTLTKHTNAADAMAKITGAAKMAVLDPKGIPGDLGAALQRAEREALTAPQQIHHLLATASNNPFSSNKAFRGFMNMWGSIFGATEVFNRRVAFISSYQTARQNGMDDAAAYSFAKDIVEQTQGIYNKGNKPNLARGAIGSTVMTFKQFSIMYLELLRRMPPKQQLMMLGVMAMAAGAEGLPFAEDIEDVIDTLGQWLGYSTNTGKWLGKKVRETLGSEWERPLLKGLGGMLPGDLHSRLGMANLIPGTAYFKPSEVDKTRDVQEAVGPVGSALGMLSDSLQMLARGRWDKAALNAAPKAVKDAYNGIYMGTTGESQDIKGHLGLKDVTLGEAIGKGIGFNPQRQAIESEAKRETMQDKNMRSVRLDEITSDWADGILRKDPEKVKESIARIVAWNADNPEMRLDASAVLRAVQERVKAGMLTSEQRFLKSMPRTMKQEAKSELHP